MTTKPEKMAEAADATFRRMFDAELAFVCRILRRLGVREADIADVAQEVFLTVHARLREHDPARPVRTWLYAFCLRFASNYRRLARHRGEGLGDREPPCPGDMDRATATRDLVLRALDRLDEDRRNVIVLHDMEGLSAPEVAELMNTPLNTVYSRIRLAREDFRRAVSHLSTGATT